MVLRRDAAGALAVGQPAHAALCGQFARAWGNERFGTVVPLTEVALGAEQHDVGWATRDLAPVLDPETGFPCDFMHTPLTEGVALWPDGPSRLESQSRWAALLATMHGRRLYERIDLARRDDHEAAAVRELLAESAAREHRLIDALRGDPATAGQAHAAAIARNCDLVWTWDVLSLVLLLDWAPTTLTAVPTGAGGAVDVQLHAVAAQTLSLSPWPFTDPDRLLVRTEGRRLAGPCPDAAALAHAFAAAPWETVAFTLVPAVAGR